MSLPLPPSVLVVVRTGASRQVGRQIAVGRLLTLSFVAPKHPEKQVLGTRRGERSRSRIQCSEIADVTEFTGGAL